MKYCYPPVAILLKAHLIILFVPEHCILYYTLLFKNLGSVTLIKKNYSVIQQE